jgi:hypothetical protein
MFDDILPVGLGNVYLFYVTNKSSLKLITGSALMTPMGSSLALNARVRQEPWREFTLKRSTHRSWVLF